MHTSSLKDLVLVGHSVTFLLQWVQKCCNFEVSPSNYYYYYYCYYSYSFFVRFREMLFLGLYSLGLETAIDRNLKIEI